jgi:hypothetical protein
VIFCEGEASEPDYLNGVKRQPQIRRNTSVEIEIDPTQGVPLTLVQSAIARQKHDEIDECWCVFDVEWPRHHPHLDRALQLAQAHGIRVAVSNPCFELWLILHFQDQAAFLDTHQAESRSRTLDGRTGKVIDPADYLPRRQEACRRAAALKARHEKDGTRFPNDNPSSTVHDLLAALEPSAE